MYRPYRRRRATSPRLVLLTCSGDSILDQSLGIHSRPSWELIRKCASLSSLSWRLYAVASSLGSQLGGGIEDGTKIVADTKATIDMLLEIRNKARMASPCLRRLICGNRGGGRILSEIVRNRRGILDQVRARTLFHDLAAFHYVCIG